MQRYHDPSTDPLPLRSPFHEAERQRLQQLTEEFLNKGGEIKDVGFQMKDKYNFVIDASKSPVYAHLFQPAPAGEHPAVAAPVTVAKTEPDPLSSCETVGEAVACQVRALARLGYAPKKIAALLDMSEKVVRQICRDHQISFRQR